MILMGSQTATAQLTCPQLGPLAPSCPWPQGTRPQTAEWGGGLAEIAFPGTQLLGCASDVTGTPVLQGQTPGDPEPLTGQFPTNR